MNNLARLGIFGIFGKAGFTLTANVLQVGVCDGEVGCEHRGCDFATIVTITDEAVDEAWTMGWLVEVS